LIEVSIKAIGAMGSISFKLMCGIRDLSCCEFLAEIVLHLGCNFVSHHIDGLLNVGRMRRGKNVVEIL
jgi:hypothetical protein